MIKRLLLSFAVISATAASLTFGAFAYFKDTAEANVTITAGDSDLQVGWDDDCSGGPESGYLDGPVPLTWSDIVPNDSEVDCVWIKNTGDGNLDIYLDTTNYTVTALLPVIQFHVQNSSGTEMCGGWANPNHANYTSANSGRGCFLVDELAPGQETWVKVFSRFYDDGTNQTGYENDSLVFDLTVDGYTD